jgi:hypothetical protein
MKRIFLLGDPLGHSLSPAMQNAALRASDWIGNTNYLKHRVTDWAMRLPGCARTIAPART